MRIVEGLIAGGSCFSLPGCSYKGTNPTIPFGDHGAPISDFYFALGAGGVGLEAGPGVFGWGGGEASGYGVSVEVAEFFAVFGW